LPLNTTGRIEVIGRDSEMTATAEKPSRGHEIRMTVEARYGAKIWIAAAGDWRERYRRDA